MNLVERFHGAAVASRRAQVIAARLAAVVPQRASVLDVGCGDGQIAALLQRHRPDVNVRGVDVLVRPETHVPVEHFDGRTLPVAAESFDAVMLVDVLHHCDWPMELLAEARRVARQAIIIKDHMVEGFAADRTLRFMDGVGNRRHGVALPHAYWTPQEWTAAFRRLGLTVQSMERRLGLYAWPLNMAFDRRLHFLAKLAVAGAARAVTESSSKLATTR